MVETSTLNEEISEIKTSKFSEISRQVTVPLISILLAFVLGMTVLTLMGYNAGEALEHMTIGASSDRNLATSLFYSTPLIFTGLSVAVAFRAGMFNIGTQGQMLMGAFTAALVGFGLQWNLEKIDPNITIPPIIFVPILIIAGCVGGALWALVPALLKARGVHEVITTIMMNYIASTFLVFLVGGTDSPFIDQGANVTPQTPKIPLTARLPLVFERAFSQLHWGFFIAIAACIIVFIILWKTKLGYETRTVGYNPNAAKYGGINVNRSLIKTMLISGALGGLAGAVEVMGTYYMYQDKSLAGYGFDGIAVALIGGNHPIGVIFGAILFGWLQTAGFLLQVNQFPRDIASTLKGFIVFIVAIPMIAKMIIGFFGYHYEDSWLYREIKGFWDRYNNRKGNLVSYTRKKISVKPVILSILTIILILIPIYSLVGVLLAFFVVFLILFSGWCLTLTFSILSNFFSYFLGPDIGGILDLTNLSSVLDGFNNPIGGLGIFVLENLWIITGIIFIVMLIYNRKIVTMLLNSFIFFTELCFFILHFIYLLFLKKPYLYILRFVNDIKNRRFFQRIRNSFDWFIGLLEKLYFFEIAFAFLLFFILNLYSVFFPSSLDSIFLLGTTTISLVAVIVLYNILKKIPKNRYTSNFSTEILLVGFWIGSMEFFIFLDIFGQDVTLFGAILVIALFVLYQEFRASRQALKEKLTNLRNLDLSEDVRAIVNKYIFFIGITFVLFLFMILGSDAYLPVQFNILLFWLNNYGSVIGILGILFILIGFYFLRGKEIISNPRDVYYLPYLYNGLSMIFIFFSIATFLSRGKAEYALFSVLFGSLLLTAIYIIILELLVKKNSEIMTRLRERKFKTVFSENRTESTFLLLSTLTVFTTMLLSYTGIYTSYYFIPIVAYVLIVVIGILLTLIRKFLNRKKLIQPAIEESERIENNNQLVKYYSMIFSYLVLISIFINYIPIYQLPMQFNLFFFKLKDFGSAFGVLGLILVISGFILFKRIPAGKNNGSKYLSIIFNFLSILVIFQALYTFFSMDPFSLISLTLVIATPIGFASLGGMFSEKSGVVNIGLEGMMLTGAFSAVWVTTLTGSPWFGVLGAVIAGALTGLLHAIASIKFRADQVVVGVALNLLASALTTLGIVVVWETVGQSDPSAHLQNITMEFLQNIPIIGDFLYRLTGSNIGLSPLVYLFIVLILLSAWVIQRTRFGLRVRAVGEKPRAADTLGINVFKMRYIAVILSGILAAVGGAQLTIGWVPIFGKDMTTGRGFVALAALIFGGWNPIGAALASLLFGFTIAFRFQLDILFNSLDLNWVVLNLHLEKLTPMLPFVITIIAVGTVAKRMRPPAADGVPYVKEG